MPAAKSHVEWTQFHSNQAQAYEQYLVPAIFGRFALRLVAAARVEAGLRVLDLACGTGVVARVLSTLVMPSGRVVGVDQNPQMLEVASALASLEWVQASADSMPIPDGSFDLVVCQQGLQFFPDRVAALREVHRVLAPSGRLMVSVWRDIGVGFDALAEALHRHVGPEAGAALSRGPASLRDERELRRLVEEAGFRHSALSVAVEEAIFPSAEQFVVRYLAATPLGSALASSGEGVREKVLAQVANRLEPFTTNEGLRWPLESNVLSALRDD